MSRIRLNQEFRNKVGVKMKSFAEQEKLLKEKIEREENNE